MLGLRERPQAAQRLAWDSQLLERHWMGTAQGKGRAVGYCASSHKSTGQAMRLVSGKDAAQPGAPSE